jgi:hypothetical protein
MNRRLQIPTIRTIFGPRPDSIQEATEEGLGRVIQPRPHMLYALPMLLSPSRLGKHDPRKQMARRLRASFLANSKLSPTGLPATAGTLARCPWTVF